MRFPLTVDNVVGLIVVGVLITYLVLAIKYPDRF
ncbi:K(+)-transporting ATPase subunit F [Kitasatospora sp. NPDC051853]